LRVGDDPGCGPFRSDGKTAAMCPSYQGFRKQEKRQIGKVSPLGATIF